jgi:hypothetical protein
MDETSLFFQTGVESLDIDWLPDGSVAIFDRRSKSVHSLNRSATILWEACASGATMHQLTEALDGRLGVVGVENEIADWIDQMRQLDLIVSQASVPVAGAEPRRRSLLAAIGGVLPVVLTLTAAEQRAYSKHAGSEGGGRGGGGTMPHMTTRMMTTAAGGRTTPFMSTRMGTATSAPFTTTLIGTTTTSPPFTTTLMRTTTSVPFRSTRMKPTTTPAP